VKEQVFITQSLNITLNDKTLKKYRKIHIFSESNVEAQITYIKNNTVQYNLHNNYCSLPLVFDN